MGFETYLVKYPKHEGFISGQYRLIDEYFNAESNPWVFENFSSADAYIQSTFGEKISKEDAEFFRPFLHSGGDYEEKRIYTKLGIWGRDSSKIFDEIRFHCQCSDYAIPLAKETVSYYINYFMDKVENLLGNMITINASFKTSDNGVIIVTECDGVETVDDNGNIRRIFTNDYEGYSRDSFFIENGEEFTLVLSFLKVFLNAFTTTDFEKEIVFLEASF